MVDILHRVGVKAPRDKVYQALATREGLANWWTRDTQGDSSPVALQNGDSDAITGRRMAFIHGRECCP